MEILTKDEQKRVERNQERAIGFWIGYATILCSFGLVYLLGYFNLLN